MRRNKGREQNQAIAIIIPWKESVQSYAGAGRSVRVKRPASCPWCLDKDLIFWSGYPRYVATPGEEFRIFIHRVLCKGCGKTHGLIPWFLLAGRHDTVHIIGHALWLKAMEMKSQRFISRMLEIPLSTVRGWSARFSLTAERHHGRALFLLHSSGANAPPLPPCDCCQGALLLFQMLFSQTSLAAEPRLFWPYVSLLTEGGLLHQHKPALCPQT